MAGTLAKSPRSPPALGPSLLGRPQAGVATSAGASGPRLRPEVGPRGVAPPQAPRAAPTAEPRRLPVLVRAVPLAPGGPQALGRPLPSGRLPDRRVSAPRVGDGPAHGLPRPQVTALVIVLAPSRGPLAQPPVTGRGPVTAQTVATEQDMDGLLPTVGRLQPPVAESNATQGTEQVLLTAGKVVSGRDKQAGQPSTTGRTAAF